MSASAAVKIPTEWTEADRRAYAKIGKRRKEEHVAAYAVVSIGSQLFYDISLLPTREAREDDGRDADADESADAAPDAGTGGACERAAPAV